MKLRTQLVFVSLLALCLPWAGARFIYEIESVLRFGQQETLAAVATSVALLVEGRPEMLNPLVRRSINKPAGKDIYFYTHSVIPTVDGYPEFDADSNSYSQEFVEENWPNNPMRAQFVGISNAVEAYVFINVVDASIRYHNPAAGGLANGDHIVFALGAGATAMRFFLAPEAPGEFVAKYRGQQDSMSEARIRGVWRDTASGYQVEVKMPLDLLGEQFGFAVVDGEKRARQVGSLDAAGRPGRLIRKDAELTALLATFSRDNLRYSLLDIDGWVLARSGNVVYQPPVDDTSPAGAWMLEFIYRWAMFDRPIGAAYESHDAARIFRDEVVQAQAGELAANWYSVDGDRGVAIGSIALPLRVDGKIIAVLLAEQSSSQILSLTNSAVTRLLSLTVVATFLIGGGLLAYASLLSLRIRRLGRSVGQVLTEDGQITGKFPQHFAQDELGDLGRHFGRLLGRMQEYNHYLRTLASKLSHELRTPLAVVSSSLDNLHHETDIDKTRDYIERARSGTDRLSRILTAMSAAGRVEESIRSAELESLDLKALLASHVSSYREAFNREIECALPDRPVEITGSADLIAQMLDKLMENADDFCPADGRIRFTLVRDPQDVVLSVENEGPGLPESMRGEIFESMVSVRPASRASVHLGLGLTIVRLVVEFHRGAVRAENMAEGGVRMVARLPVSRG